MRIDGGLAALVDEHRRGAALAQRLLREGRQGANAALAELARAALETELEPHFRLEEELLLPALAWAGGQTLVGRTLREHAALREHVAAALKDPRRVLQFARLLEEHLRFEELEVYPATERLLAPDDLERISTGGAGVRRRAEG